jgi:hypothetical protein
VPGPHRRSRGGGFRSARRGSSIMRNSLPRNICWLRLYCLCAAPGGTLSRASRLVCTPILAYAWQKRDPASHPLPE